MGLVVWMLLQWWLAQSSGYEGHLTRLVVAVGGGMLVYGALMGPLLLRWRRQSRV